MSPTAAFSVPVLFLYPISFPWKKRERKLGVINLLTQFSCAHFLLAPAAVFLPCLCKSCRGRIASLFAFIALSTKKYLILTERGKKIERPSGASLYWSLQPMKAVSVSFVTPLFQSNLHLHRWQEDICTLIYGQPERAEKRTRPF